MPLVGAVAAPHSHLQLFTRPAENEQYKADVQKGRNAMIALRAQVERADPDTILVIHDDHFVNFDFRCYPPFALFVGQEVLTTNFLNPKADKRVMLLFTNGYVPPLPWPRRCYKLGQAIREIIDE